MPSLMGLFKRARNPARDRKLIEVTGKRVKVGVKGVSNELDALFDKKSPTNADIMDVLKVLYERGRR